MEMTPVTKTGQTCKPANVVGPRLRKVRLKAGLTQQELAAHCQKRGMKLTRGTLAKIEAQLRFIKACELFVISLILNVAMESFYPPGFGGQRAA